MTTDIRPPGPIGYAQIDPAPATQTMAPSSFTPTTPTNAAFGTPENPGVAADMFSLNPNDPNGAMTIAVGETYVDPQTGADMVMGPHGVSTPATPTPAPSGLISSLSGLSPIGSAQAADAPAAPAADGNGMPIGAVSALAAAPTSSPYGSLNPNASYSDPSSLSASPYGTLSQPNANAPVDQPGGYMQAAFDAASLADNGTGYGTASPGISGYDPSSLLGFTTTTNVNPGIPSMAAQAMGGGDFTPSLGYASGDQSSTSAPTSNDINQVGPNTADQNKTLSVPGWAVSGAAGLVGGPIAGLGVAGLNWGMDKMGMGAYSPAGLANYALSHPGTNNATGSNNSNSGVNQALMAAYAAAPPLNPASTDSTASAPSAPAYDPTQTSAYQAYLSAMNNGRTGAGTGTAPHT